MQQLYIIKSHQSNNGTLSAHCNHFREMVQVQAFPSPKHLIKSFNQFLIHTKIFVKSGNVTLVEKNNLVLFNCHKTS